MDVLNEYLKKRKPYSAQTRHDRVCLKIFLKRDELKQSYMETSFNEISQTGKKGKNLDEYHLNFNRAVKKSMWTMLEQD